MSYPIDNYDGDLLNGLPDGKGVMLFPDGSQYEGDWSRGKRHGVGFIITPGSKPRYSCFIDDVDVGQCIGIVDDSFIKVDPISFEGQIISVSDNGDLYRGYWKDGKRNGYGKLVRHNGFESQGFFFKDLLIGEVYYLGNHKYERALTTDVVCGKQVRILYKNRSTYVGSVNGNLKRHGFGTLTKSGHDYSGLFINDDFIAIKVQSLQGSDIDVDYSGEVHALMADGSSYTGGWFQGRNGMGKSVLKGEYTYYGNWNNNVRDGFGKCSYSNGNSYEGSFKEGRIDGNGLFSYSDGSSYKGSFSNGKRNGFGRYSFDNGVYAEGIWKDDLKNGDFYFDLGNDLDVDASFSNDSLIGDCIFKIGDVNVDVHCSEPVSLNTKESSLPQYIIDSILNIFNGGLLGKIGNEKIGRIQSLLYSIKRNESKTIISSVNTSTKTNANDSKQLKTTSQTRSRFVSSSSTPSAPSSTSRSYSYYSSGGGCNSAQ